MAEQIKTDPPSEENQRYCPFCKSVASEIIHYVEMLDKEAFREMHIKKKRAKSLGSGAMAGSKTDDRIDLSKYSEVPKTGANKCEEKPIGEDKIVKPEEIEKCVGGLKSLSPSMKRGALQNREIMKKLLERMLDKYPHMVVTQSEADDEGNPGDFYMFCTQCPASFTALGLARQHFEENIHN